MEVILTIVGLAILFFGGKHILHLWREKHKKPKRKNYDDYYKEWQDRVIIGETCYYKQYKVIIRNVSRERGTNRKMAIIQFYNSFHRMPAYLDSLKPLF